MVRRKRRTKVRRVYRRVKKTYRRKRGFTVAGLMNKLAIPALVGLGTVFASNMLGNKDVDIRNIPANVTDPAKIVPLLLGIGASAFGKDKIGTALQSAGWVVLCDQANSGVRTGDYIVTL